MKSAKRNISIPKSLSTVNKVLEFSFHSWLFQHPVSSVHGVGIKNRKTVNSYEGNDWEKRWVLSRFWKNSEHWSWRDDLMILWLAYEHNQCLTIQGITPNFLQQYFTGCWRFTEYVGIASTCGEDLLVEQKVDGTMLKQNKAIPLDACVPELNTDI